MANGSKKNGGGDVVLESRHLVGLFVLMVAIFGVVFLLGYELGRNQYGDQVRASNATTEENSGAAVKPNAKASAAQPAVESIAPPSAQPVNKKSPAATTPKDTASNAAPNASSGPPADYDFYKLGQPNQPPANLAPAPKAAAAKPTPKSATPTPTISVPGKTTAAPPASSVKAQPAPSKPANTAKSQPAGMSGPLIPRGSILLQVSAMSQESDALRMAEQLQQKKFPTIVIPPGADKFYHVQVGPYADAKSADAARAALEKAGFKSIVKR
jgi:cell division septation protein DedD